MLKHASRACFGGVLPNLCLLRPVSCVRRFALPHKLQLLGLPAGMCVKLKVSLNGKTDIEQAFNPISTDDTPGEMTILVKVRAVPCIMSSSHIIPCKMKSITCLSSFFTPMCKPSQGAEPL